jgi:hypothetical protein
MELVSFSLERDTESPYQYADLSSLNWQDVQSDSLSMS